MMMNPKDTEKQMYKININDRNYTSWTIVKADTLENSEAIAEKLNPSNLHLFSGDIFSFNEETIEAESAGEAGAAAGTEEYNINIVHSSVRSSDNIPAVLILENNKTYGRKNGTKGKLLYKCIPDDIRIPPFLVPYEIKHVGFSKVFTNVYVTICFSEWTDKHPIATISQTIGPIDILNNYYEYQLYCKSLNSSIQKFTKDATKALETYLPKLEPNPPITKEKKTPKNTNSSRHDTFIENMCKHYPHIESRTDFSQWRIFTIDPRASLDYDDAFSIKNVYNEDGVNSNSNRKDFILISIYIANVTIWMDFLNLWSSFSQRISTIYLPDQKRPMLPTILSDCLCSLQANSSRVAFVLDIMVDPVSQTIVSTKYSNCVIKVFKNFVYEEPALIKNADYTFLLQTCRALLKTNKYISSVRNSHELVSFLMVLMNHTCAKDLLEKRVGIFRSTIISTNNNFIPSDINDEVAKFIKIWNSSCGYYTDISTIAATSDLSNIKHELLDIDAYVHITSPIRRLVDLLNIIQLQNVCGIINLSNYSIQFYNKWISQIDYINITMRAIKKVQADCLLLDACYNHPETLEKGYEGYCFDKLVRSDGLFQFIVFLPELKIASRITTRENMENFDKRQYKLFLFNNEERFKKKIRLHLI